MEERQGQLRGDLLPGRCTGMRECPEPRMDFMDATVSSASAGSMNTCSMGVDDHLTGQSRSKRKYILACTHQLTTAP